MNVLYAWINWLNATDSYFVYILKMAYASKININGKKWSRKKIFWNCKLFHLLYKNAQNLKIWRKFRHCFSTVPYSYMVAVHSYFNHSSLTAIFLGQSTKFDQFPPRLAGNIWKLKGINYQELTVLIYTVKTLTIDTLLKWKKSHNEKIATHLLTLLAQHIKNKP